MPKSTTKEVAIQTPAQAILRPLRERLDAMRAQSQGEFVQLTGDLRSRFQQRIAECVEYKLNQVLDEVIQD